jgi:hypothetical protein
MDKNKTSEKAYKTEEADKTSMTQQEGEEKRKRGK